ncbi:Interferon-induced transmembrane protein [Segniliparus rotundus DSM 44985]|uniref:Interferon-induced transmembrane protein n=1 Tax=Segniliparus rotundus (strain ATCC BAA-972 / CDC 1076 / CIP 108378 / DSM 44985 / JCM 13578) TaxID=640132 RepID=D6ZBH6_SEGRD|nr:CD225/dispanin family protein [Segniliparus rotundus]ADG98928.1 Interferon-induced transmembrane protein [Segniliparus rotundus DSM 44985]
MTQAPEQHIAYAQPGQPQPPRQAGPPPSNVGWAVASVVCFFPFAFVAFTHALNVFPLWAQGDQQGAQEASGKAKFWGWFSIGACVVSTLLFLLLWLVLHLVKAR